MEITVYSILFGWSLLIGYVALTHAKYKVESGQNIGFFWRVVLYPALAVFLVGDSIFNLVFGTAMFMEPPQEWLFTSRVQRWVDAGYGAGWRNRLAVWWANRLNTFDDHVRM